MRAEAKPRSEVQALRQVPSGIYFEDGVGAAFRHGFMCSLAYTRLKG